MSSVFHAGKVSDSKAMHNQTQGHTTTLSPAGVMAGPLCWTCWAMLDLFCSTNPYPFGAAKLGQHKQMSICQSVGQVHMHMLVHSNLANHNPSTRPLPLLGTACHGVAVKPTGSGSHAIQQMHTVCATQPTSARLGNQHWSACVACDVLQRTTRVVASYIQSCNAAAL